MKKTLKVLAVGATICASMAVGAIAASKQEEIKAYMDYGITIKLDGQVKQLTNASGERQYPIRYKGTTYVPLRAVSQLVGLPVNWDGTTETVLLGNDGSNAKVDLTTVTATKATSTSWLIRNSSDLTIQGEDGNMYFNSGVAYKNQYLRPNEIIYFDVNGKNTLEFSAWTNLDTNVHVYDENKNIVDNFLLKAGKLEDRTININGIQKVGFAADAVKAFSEPTLKILDPVIYNK